MLSCGNRPKDLCFTSFLARNRLQHTTTRSRTSALGSQGRLIAITGVPRITSETPYRVPLAIRSTQHGDARKCYFSIHISTRRDKFFLARPLRMEIVSGPVYFRLKTMNQWTIKAFSI